MGLVQGQAKRKSWLTKVPVGAKNIKFGPKWVENRQFGPKQRPNESYGLSGPIRTTPEAKNGQKIDFSRKTAPGGPRRPPFHRCPPGLGSYAGVMEAQFAACPPRFRWKVKSLSHST